MYLQRFGLTRRPFPTTPDSSLYYPATGHEAALQQIERALRDEEGLVLLTGGPGSGKTLLAHCLLERLGEDRHCAFLTNSHLPDRSALFQALLFDLALPYEGTEQILRLRLTDFLLNSARDGKKTLFLLDEAQHLSADLCEELRLLGNLEGSAGKAVEIVLLAQPDFLDTLGQKSLAGFVQRMAVKAALDPLGLEESLDYLLHHLRWAGGRPEAIFDENALEVLARAAQGIPRLLNQAAQQSLVLADIGELPIVDAEAALEAIGSLGLETESPLEEDPGQNIRLINPIRKSA